MHICGINLNASQIVWIALKDYKKLFYCFFICLDLTIKYNLCCIYHPNSENRFRTFLREASHTFFYWKDHDKNTKTTILYIEILKRKIGSLFFWPRMNLFHVVINLCWFFFVNFFPKENSSSILYDARQKKQKILLTFFHNLVENKTFQGLNKMVEVLWFVYVMK